jgi:hypothetical protein
MAEAKVDTIGIRLTPTQANNWFVRARAVEMDRGPCIRECAEVGYELKLLYQHNPSLARTISNLISESVSQALHGTCNGTCNGECNGGGNDA